MSRVASKYSAAIRWAAVVAWAAVIFIGSAQPGSTIPGGYSVEGHLGEYFIFGALLFWALHLGRTPMRATALAVVLASLYGISDEIHQHFVVMRTPDVTDWGLDTVGAFLGAVAISGVTAWLARRRLAHDGAHDRDRPSAQKSR